MEEEEKEDSLRMNKSSKCNASSSGMRKSKERKGRKAAMISIQSERRYDDDDGSFLVDACGLNRAEMVSVVVNGNLLSSSSGLVWSGLGMVY